MYTESLDTLAQALLIPQGRQRMELCQVCVGLRVTTSKNTCKHKLGLVFARALVLGDVLAVLRVNSPEAQRIHAHTHTGNHPDFSTARQKGMYGGSG